MDSIPWNVFFQTRAYIEDMFYKYGVDLQFWAHEHSYERLWPIYNFTVMFVLLLLTETLCNYQCSYDYWVHDRILKIQHFKPL